MQVQPVHWVAAEALNNLFDCSLHLSLEHGMLTSVTFAKQELLQLPTIFSDIYIFYSTKRLFLSRPHTN